MHNKIIEIVMAILKGMLQISIGRNWLSTTANILNANQLFCQALYRHQPSLLLLPHLTREKIKTFRGQKRAVESISDLFSLEEAERAALLKDFDSKQIADINQVASKYQQAFFINAEYVVEGEPAIIPSSIVTLNVKVGSWSLKPRVDYDKAFGEPDKKQWWEDSKGANAYTPGLAHKRNPSWYVSLTNHQIDRVICAGKITGLDNDKTVKLQFQAPPQAGSWTFTIYCMSDSYPETTIRRELEVFILLT